VPVEVQHNSSGIAAVMLEAGIQNDFVDLASSLDLNDPEMANELNTLLKPLEILSR
jgi:hypothetical protein